MRDELICMALRHCARIHLRVGRPAPGPVYLQYRCERCARHVQKFEWAASGDCTKLHAEASQLVALARARESLECPSCRARATSPDVIAICSPLSRPYQLLFTIVRAAGAPTQHWVYAPSSGCTAVAASQRKQLFAELASEHGTGAGLQKANDVWPSALGIRHEALIDERGFAAWAVDPDPMLPDTTRAETAFRQLRFSDAWDEYVRLLPDDPERGDPRLLERALLSAYHAEKYGAVDSVSRALEAADDASVVGAIGRALLCGPEDMERLLSGWRSVLYKARRSGDRAIAWMAGERVDGLAFGAPNWNQGVGAAEYERLLARSLRNDGATIVDFDPPSDRVGVRVLLSRDSFGAHTAYLLENSAGFRPTPAALGRALDAVRGTPKLAGSRIVILSQNLHRWSLYASACGHPVLGAVVDQPAGSAGNTRGHRLRQFSALLRDGFRREPQPNSASLADVEHYLRVFGANGFSDYRTHVSSLAVEWILAVLSGRFGRLFRESRPGQSGEARVVARLRGRYPVDVQSLVDQVIHEPGTTLEHQVIRPLVDARI